jgi:sensor histidine kinase regulating citrate/malate metabolism
MNQRVTFSTTGNLAVDSIVNYKLQKIVGQDVEIETEIAVPEELSIEVADVVSLIGNLLDNALQALEYVSQEKYLYLKIMYSESRLLIRVRNRHANQVQYENGEIVTTKSNRKEHGFGLKSIRAVAEHYQGLVKVEHDKTYFTTDVLLYL